MHAYTRTHAPIAWANTQTFSHSFTHTHACNLSHTLDPSHAHTHTHTLQLDKHALSNTSFGDTVRASYDRWDGERAPWMGKGFYGWGKS